MIEEQIPQLDFLVFELYFNIEFGLLVQFEVSLHGLDHCLVELDDRILVAFVIDAFPLICQFLCEGINRNSGKTITMALEVDAISTVTYN